MRNETKAPAAGGQFNETPGTPPANFAGGDPAAAMAAFGTEVRGQIGEVAAQVGALAATVAELPLRIEAVESRAAALPDEPTLEARFNALVSGDEFAEIAEQLEQLQTTVGRQATFGAAAPQQRRSIFADHLESTAFKQWIKDGCPKEHPGVRTQLSGSLHHRGGQFAVDVDDTLVGALDPSHRRPGVIELLRDPIGLMDVINEVAPIGSRNLDYYRETAMSETGALATVLTEAIDGDPTAKTTCTVENSEGFFPGVTVLFYTAGGIESEVLVSKVDATGVLTFGADELDFDAAVGVTVTSQEILATAEGAEKPAGLLEVEEVSVTLQTIATYIVTTRQRLQYSSVTNLASWISQRLPLRWRETMEWHLLYGSGTNQQLHGFLNAAILPAGQTDVWSTSLSTGDTRADLILWAAAQIPGAVRKVAVLNPRDWFHLTNYKASDGHYVQNLAEGPRIIDTPGLKAVGSVQVVESRKVLETTGLVFAPEFASELTPGAPPELWTGYVNNQRIENKFTHLYEQDMVNALLDDRAWRKVSFDGAPA